MIKSAPFTRYVAAILALLMLRASICCAASPPPGSIGILEFTKPDHEMRAAWEKATGEICLDPLLLVLNDNEIASILAEWREAGEAVEMAWRTADRSVLERTHSLLDEAWNAYYAFGFDRTLGFLQEAEDLLTYPGDSRFRSRLAFEINVLEGMARQAVNDNSSEEFKKAAAVSPSAELSPERYSPEIILAYSRAREELVSGGTVLADIDLSPDDAAVFVDGNSVNQEQGRAHLRVFPGRHFLEVQNPGYEPLGYVLDVGLWDSPSLKFNLIQSGPSGEPDIFFLGRLKAGDRSYLSRLLEKLGVDYVLIPDAAEGVLHAWVVGRDGRTITHGTIWEPGDDAKLAVMNLSAMVGPLRQDREDIQQPAAALMNLPHVRRINLEIDGKDERGTDWKSYSVILGILIIVAAAAASSGGEGGTTVEVSW